jgi:ABC-type phosphate/phosphonate transport system substrate-binding protein
LTKVLSRVSAKPVETRPFIDVRLFLDELGKRPPPAFIFAKTVDILADQIANTRYVPVVKINKPYVAGIILAEGSKAKTLHDLIGTDVLLPPPETMTAKLAMAAFHDAGIQVVAKDQKETFPTNIEGKVTVRHVQYQEVIPSTVNLGYWYQAGAVNPTMMGKWRGKVLLKFKPQPNWSIAAFAETPPAVVAAATAAFTSLHESADGAAALAAMKIERFVLADRAEYVELANYVK